MANRVSSPPLSRNTQRQNISSSNTRSSRSTVTTHTYASTNTYNTEPTYTSTPIAGDPRTLHSYYVASSNYRPTPTSPVSSATRHAHIYEPSYPSISRFRLPSSSSPYRKAHYLDDSDEEIVTEEVIEVTDLNHYPTLAERWGDESRPVVRQEGDLKIEDYVEFEETEPTVVEEILYELVYSGDDLRSCRQIHRSRSESRNFRKIKKRRTRRKRQPFDESSYFESQNTSRDTSGTRSPVSTDRTYTRERSSTPVQSTLPSSWQSTGFLAGDKTSIDINVRDRYDNQNYVNYVKVNENEPYRSKIQVEQYPQTQTTSDAQYRRYEADPGLKQYHGSFYETGYSPKQGTTSSISHYDVLSDTAPYVPLMKEEQGITRINITTQSYDYAPENIYLKTKPNVIDDTYEISSSDKLLTSITTTDDTEQSRTNIIDQTSAPKEINRDNDHSKDNERKSNEIITTKNDESEKEDEDPSSATAATIREFKIDDELEKDTDEDASFSENEPISSKSLVADDKNQSLNLEETAEELVSTGLQKSPENQADHKAISKTAAVLIDEINKIESQLDRVVSIDQIPESIINVQVSEQQETVTDDKPITNAESLLTEAKLEQQITEPLCIDNAAEQIPEILNNDQEVEQQVAKELSIDEKVEQQLHQEPIIDDKFQPEADLGTESLEEFPDASIPVDMLQDESSLSSAEVMPESIATGSDQDLRSFLNSLTAHLMPELTGTFDDETEDEPSCISETKSSEEPMSIDDQASELVMLKSIEDVKGQLNQYGENISSDEMEELGDINIDLNQQQPIKINLHDAERDDKEKSMPIFSMSDSTGALGPGLSEDKTDSAIDEQPISSDSLADDGRRIVNLTKWSQDDSLFDDNKPDTSSQASSIIVDDISTQLPIQQIASQRFEYLTERQLAGVDSLADIINEMNARPLQSSSNRQTTLTDTSELIEPVKEKKLSTVDSTVESTQSIITSDKQQEPSTSPIATEVYTPLKSATVIGNQTSLELPTTEDTQGEISSINKASLIKETAAGETLTQSGVFEYAPSAEFRDSIRENFDRPSIFQLSPNHFTGGSTLASRIHTDDSVDNNIPKDNLQEQETSLRENDNLLSRPIDLQVTEDLSTKSHFISSSSASITPVDPTQSLKATEAESVSDDQHQPITTTSGAITTSASGILPSTTHIDTKELTIDDEPKLILKTENLVTIFREIRPRRIDSLVTSEESNKSTDDQYISIGESVPSLDKQHETGIVEQKPIIDNEQSMPTTDQSVTIATTEEPLTTFAKPIAVQQLTEPNDQNQEKQSSDEASKQTSLSPTEIEVLNATAIGLKIAKPDEEERILPKADFSHETVGVIAVAQSEVETTSSQLPEETVVEVPITASIEQNTIEKQDDKQSMEQFLRGEYPETISPEDRILSAEGSKNKDEENNAQVETFTNVTQDIKQLPSSELPPSVAELSSVKQGLQTTSFERTTEIVNELLSTPADVPHSATEQLEESTREVEDPRKILSIKALNEMIEELGETISSADSIVDTQTSDGIITKSDQQMESGELSSSLPIEQDHVSEHQTSPGDSKSKDNDSLATISSDLNEIIEHLATTTEMDQKEKEIENYDQNIGSRSIEVVNQVIKELDSIIASSKDEATIEEPSVSPIVEDQESISEVRDDTEIVDETRPKSEKLLSTLTTDNVTAEIISEVITEPFEATPRTPPTSEIPSDTEAKEDVQEDENPSYQPSSMSDVRLMEKIDEPITPFIIITQQETIDTSDTHDNLPEKKVPTFIGEIEEKATTITTDALTQTICEISKVPTADISPSTDDVVDRTSEVKEDLEQSSLISSTNILPAMAFKEQPESINEKGDTMGQQDRTVCSTENENSSPSQNVLFDNTEQQIYPAPMVADISLANVSETPSTSVIIDDSSANHIEKEKIEFEPYKDTQLTLPTSESPENSDTSLSTAIKQNLTSSDMSHDYVQRPDQEPSTTSVTEMHSTDVQANEVEAIASESEQISPDQVTKDVQESPNVSDSIDSFVSDQAQEVPETTSADDKLTSLSVSDLGQESDTTTSSLQSKTQEVTQESDHLTSSSSAHSVAEIQTTDDVVNVEAAERLTSDVLNAAAQDLINEPPKIDTILITEKAKELVDTEGVPETVSPPSTDQQVERFEGEETSDVTDTPVTIETYPEIKQEEPSLDVTQLASEITWESLLGTTTNDVKEDTSDHTPSDTIPETVQELLATSTVEDLQSKEAENKEQFEDTSKFITALQQAIVSDTLETLVLVPPHEDTEVSTDIKHAEPELVSVELNPAKAEQEVAEYETVTSEDARQENEAENVLLQSNLETDRDTDIIPVSTDISTTDQLKDDIVQATLPEKAAESREKLNLQDELQQPLTTTTDGTNIEFKALPTITVTDDILMERLADDVSLKALADAVQEIQSTLLGTPISATDDKKDEPIEVISQEREPAATITEELSKNLEIASLITAIESQNEGQPVPSQQDASIEPNLAPAVAEKFDQTTSELSTALPEKDTEKHSVTEPDLSQPLPETTQVIVQEITTPGSPDVKQDQEEIDHLKDHDKQQATESTVEISTHTETGSITVHSPVVDVTQDKANKQEQSTSAAAAEDNSVSMTESILETSSDGAEEHAADQVSTAAITEAVQETLATSQFVPAATIAEESEKNGSIPITQGTSQKLEVMDSSVDAPLKQQQQEEVSFSANQDTRIEESSASSSVESIEKTSSEAQLLSYEDKTREEKTQDVSLQPSTKDIVPDKTELKSDDSMIVEERQADKFDSIIHQENESETSEVLEPAPNVIITGHESNIKVSTKEEDQVSEPLQTVADDLCMTVIAEAVEEMLASLIPKTEMSLDELKNEETITTEEEKDKNLFASFTETAQNVQTVEETTSQLSSLLPADAATEHNVPFPVEESLTGVVSEAVTVRTKEDTIESLGSTKFTSQAAVDDVAHEPPSDEQDKSVRSHEETESSDVKKEVFIQPVTTETEETNEPQETSCNLTAEVTPITTEALSKAESMETQKSDETKEENPVADTKPTDTTLEDLSTTLQKDLDNILSGLLPSTVLENLDVQDENLVESTTQMSSPEKQTFAYPYEYTNQEPMLEQSSSDVLNDAFLEAVATLSNAASVEPSESLLAYSETDKSSEVSIAEISQQIEELLSKTEIKQDEEESKSIDPMKSESQEAIVDTINLQVPEDQIEQPLVLRVEDTSQKQEISTALDSETVSDRDIPMDGSEQTKVHEHIPADTFDDTKQKALEKSLSAVSPSTEIDTTTTEDILRATVDTHLEQQPIIPPTIAVETENLVEQIKPAALLVIADSETSPSNTSIKSDHETSTIINQFDEIGSVISTDEKKIQEDKQSIDSAVDSTLEANVLQIQAAEDPNEKPEAKAQEQPQLSQSDQSDSATKLNETDVLCSEPETSQLPLPSVKSESPSASDIVIDNSNQMALTSSGLTTESIDATVITEAHELIEQEILEHIDNQLTEVLPSLDTSAKSVAVDTSLVNDTTTKSSEDDYSISGLENIVHNILKLPNEISPKFSIPNETNRLIISSASLFDTPVDTNEIINVIEQESKVLNSRPSVPEDSSTIQDTALERASAVTLTVNADNSEHNTATDEAPTFFVPGTPNKVESSFQELYDNRHFIINQLEERPSSFTSVDREESTVSMPLSEDKETSLESPYAYYELQEKRHTLMTPQESTGDDDNKQQTSISTITAWTSTQPLMSYDASDTKEETTDLVVDDQAYEYARRFDLESPSIVSNLPVTEYRQVFGVSDNSTTTSNIASWNIDHTDSNEQEHRQQLPTVSDAETSSATVQSDHQLSDNQIPITQKDIPISENVRRITEALHALESDIQRLEDDSQLVESFLATQDEVPTAKQESISSSELEKVLEDDIRQTFEKGTMVFPSKDSISDSDLLPEKTTLSVMKEVLTSELVTQPTSTTLSEPICISESESKDSQSLLSSSTEPKIVPTDVEQKHDGGESLRTSQDTIIDEVRKREEPTNEIHEAEATTANNEALVPSNIGEITQLNDTKSIKRDFNIDNLVETVEQIMTKPVQTVHTQLEKIMHQDQQTDSSLGAVLEEILAKTQYSINYAVLPKPTDDTLPSDRANSPGAGATILQSEHEISPPITSEFKKISEKQEPTTLEASQLLNVTETASTVLSTDLSVVLDSSSPEMGREDATELLTTKSDIQTVIEPIPSILPHETIATTSQALVSEKSTKEQESSTEQSDSSNIPLQTLAISNDASPNLTTETTMKKSQYRNLVDTTTSKEDEPLKTLSETQITRETSGHDSSTLQQSVAQDQDTSLLNDSQNFISVPSDVSSQTTAVSTSLEQESIPSRAEEPLEPQTAIIISSPVKGYFTTNDVYHAYKQIIIPVIETETKAPTIVEEPTVSSGSIPEIPEDSTALESSQAVSIQSQPLLEITSDAKSGADTLSTLPEIAIVDEIVSTVKADVNTEELTKAAEHFTESSGTIGENLAPTLPLRQENNVESVPESLAPNYFTSTDVYHARKPSTNDEIESKSDTSTTIENPATLSTETVHGVPEEQSSLLFSAATSDDTTIVTPQVPSSPIIEELKPDEQEDLLMKAAETAGKQKLTPSDTLVPVKEATIQVPVSSTETSNSDMSHDIIADSDTSAEAKSVTMISTPVPGYFTSNDVYHAHKQLIEPVLGNQIQHISTIPQTIEVPNEDRSIATEDAIITPVSTDTQDQEMRISENQATKVPPESVIQEKTIFDEALETSNEEKTTLPLTAFDQSSPKLSSSATEQLVENKTIIDVESFVPSYFTSTDVYHARKEPIQPLVEKTVETNRAFEAITAAVPIAEETAVTSKASKEEAVAVDAEVPKAEEAVAISDVANGEEAIVVAQIPMEETTPMKLIGIELPSDLPPEFVSPSMGVSIGDEKFVVVESVIPGYFTSTDVYHARKQLIQPMLREEVRLGSGKDATVTTLENISGEIHMTEEFKSNENTGLTESATVEDTTTSLQGDSAEKNVSLVVKPEDSIEEEKISSNDLVDIMKSLFPSSLRSENVEVIGSDGVQGGEEERETLGLPMEKNVVKCVESQEILTSSENLTIAEGMNHATEQVLTASRTDESATSTIIDKASSIVSGIISSLTAPGSTTETSHEAVLTSDIIAIAQNEPSQQATAEETVTTPQSSEQKDTFQEEPVSNSFGDVIEKSSSIDIPTSTNEHLTSDMETKPTNDSENISNVTEDKADTRASEEETPSRNKELIDTKEPELAESATTIYYASTDVSHAQQDVPEPMHENKDDSLTLIKKAEAVVDNIISSVSGNVTVISQGTEVLTASETMSSETVATESELSKAVGNESLTRSAEPSATLPSTGLQVVGDDYPWYSNHYAIADADAKIGSLYEQLSHTIKQLEQRPPATTIEFEPEPHEKVVLPDYDRQALIETQDTREKVHELAELSTSLNETISTSQEQDEKNNDDGFQIVKHRKHVHSSTAHEKSPLPTENTGQIVLSPDIDLQPLVIHGHPETETKSTSVILPTQSISSSSGSSKKKHKKPHKDHKETILFDAPEPAKIDSTEHDNVNIAQFEKDEHRTDLPKLPLTQSLLTEEVHETNLLPQEITSEFVVPSTSTDKSKPTVIDFVLEQEQGELLSTSINSDGLEELQPIHDEQNDSTSSDASQWLSSSFTGPEDGKTDSFTDEQVLAAPPSTILDSADLVKAPQELSETQVAQFENLPKELLQTSAKPSEANPSDGVPTEAVQVESVAIQSQQVISVTDNGRQREKSKVKPTKSTALQAHSTESEHVPQPTLSSAHSVKKKKHRHKSHDKAKDENVEVSSVADADKEQKSERKSVTPTPHTAPSTATATTIIAKTTPASSAQRTPVVISPSNEENIDDDEGFQVVSYRKHPHHSTGSDKNSSSTGLPKLKSKSSSDSDHKSTTSHGARVSSKTVGSSTTTNVATPETTTRQQKSKSTTEETTSMYKPSVVSSVDVGTKSSSATLSSKVTIAEQPFADQREKGSPNISSPAFQTKSVDQFVLSTDENEDQQKYSDVFLESQPSSLTIPLLHEADVQSEPIVSAPRTVPSSVLRPKASTSAEEENDDDEGFQVVHRRKRISSAPRPEKSLPPIPPRTSKHNRDHHGDNKTAFIHGRPASGSRSIPRANTGSQMSSQRYPPIKPQQNRQRLPPFPAKHSPTTKEGPSLSSFDTDHKKKEQNEQSSNSNRQPEDGNIIFSSASTEKPHLIEKLQSSVGDKQDHLQYQQPINVEKQSALPTIHPQTTEQKETQQKRQTPVEEVKISSIISTPVDQTIHEVVGEYLATTKEDIKSIAAKPPAKIQTSSMIITVTPETRKSTAADDEDDDGFRVVRYRRHTPSSGTSQQHSYSSDYDRKPPSSPRKPPSPSPTLPSASNISQSAPPKKKLVKPKKPKEPTTTSGSLAPSAADTVSSGSPSTSADFSVSAGEHIDSQTPDKRSPKAVELHASTIDVTTTSHSVKEAKITEQQTKPTSLSVITPKLSDENQRKIQSVESPTSPNVTSADTSEESSKKPKRKHKRSKPESLGVDLSTTSDEISSISEGLLKPQSVASASVISKSGPPALLASTPVDEKSGRFPIQEDNLLSQSIEPIPHVDDENVKTAISKRSTKRRKKKTHPTDKHDEEDIILDSSAASTTDKDSSSVTTPAPIIQTTLQSSEIQQIPSSDPAKQETESMKIEIITPTTVTNESNEQKFSFYPHSTLHATTSKISAEKATNIEIKLKKEDDLSVTSPIPIESGPTEESTVHKMSDESSLLSQDKIVSSVEQTLSKDIPTSEKSAVIEKMKESTFQVADETATDSAAVTVESSETGGEADLDAYRDQTGRLRRKKPRKHVTKSDDIHSSSPASLPVSAPSIEQSKPEEGGEHKIDSETIKEHWADVLATPIISQDDDPNVSYEHIQLEQSYEDEDTSETSSKLDSFLPEYIRQQIKSKSSPRSSSLNNERSKSNSDEILISTTHTHTTRDLAQALSNRSTSVDTSESESRKQLRESLDDENQSAEDSGFLPALHSGDHETIEASSSLPSGSMARKKKQRPKMLKKDIEAKTLLTHEFDDTPLSITEIQQAAATTQVPQDDIKENRSSLVSTQPQTVSTASTATESVSSVLSSQKLSPADEHLPIQTHDRAQSNEESSIVTSSQTIDSATTTRKKSSTRSPRKRSKRDSGPDYENLTHLSTDDIDQPSSVAKGTSASPTVSDTSDQTDSIKIESHKQRTRQRTSSGRPISSAEDDSEQQAVLADDEEDEDFATKPVTLHGSGISTHIQTPTESIADQQNLSTTTMSKKEHLKKISDDDGHEFITEAPSELKSTTDETASNEKSGTGEPLRPVQGYHSFTANKYQYNQYDEGSAVATEQTLPLTTETDEKDSILARGFTRWLQQTKEIESTSPSKPEEQLPTGGGLTRAMQSLVIQPIESDNEEEEDEDSWNGPRARKPTYTTGVRIDKRIHAGSGYNINHPRTATVSPWLMSQSNNDSSAHRDDQSKFEPDDDDSMNDVSERQQLSQTINSQLSTTEEKQMNSKNLADLNSQATTCNLSSSSSSSSAAVKWNEVSMRSTDEHNQQQQTNFTDDDVQRCLGEAFYRESLAVDTSHTGQRVLTSLNNLVVKPTNMSDDTDNDDDNDDHLQQNRNNNNNQTMNFDEWAQFPDEEYDPSMILSSEPGSSNVEQNLFTSYVCSYARELDDDTLISDADHSTLMNYVQEPYSHEKQQRYGDFLSMNDDSVVPESQAHYFSTSPNSNIGLSNRKKPSETFQRWQTQTSHNHNDFDSNSSHKISTENPNDDEIFVSYSNGAFSKQVRPNT